MKRMLHLGCGPIHFPNAPGVEWINIDKAPEHRPDICEDYLNLSRLFRRDSIDAIYTCHSIEHLDYPDGVVQFFDQAFYALQPGGTLRVVVPDLFRAVQGYVDSNRCMPERAPGLYGIYSPPEGKWYHHKEGSDAERLHFFMTAWEHKIVFDFQLLSMLMEDAGFKSIYRCAFGISPLPEFQNIDRFENESLCVEAWKP